MKKDDLQSWTQSTECMKLNTFVCNLLLSILPSQLAECERLLAAPWLAGSAHHELCNGGSSLRESFDQNPKRRPLSVRNLHLATTFCGSTAKATEPKRTCFTAPQHVVPSTAAAFVGEHGGALPARFTAITASSLIPRCDIVF